MTKEPVSHKSPIITTQQKPFLNENAWTIWTVVIMPKSTENAIAAVKLGS